ncbi:MAG: methyltransferase [Pirellulales bacterium]
MPHLYESLRQYRNVGIDEFEGTEATIYERLPRNEPLQRVFQEAMSALSLQTNRFLADFVDLADVSYLVDVGGGDGTNILALAEKHPHLRASVFDFPSVCKIAEEKLSASNCRERVGTFPGNCFVDSFPLDADCFLFCHFMTMWSEEKNRMLLRKSYEALKPGGKAIIFNMMQHDDETGPLSAAVGSPYFLALATGEGMLYTWKEYEQWMGDAGFSNVRRIVLPRDHGAILGVKH